MLFYDPSKYLAFELSDNCKSSLKSLFPPVFSKVFCHHITLFFGGIESDFNVVVNSLQKTNTFEIVGNIVHDEVECFLVEINKSNHRIDGGRYHITHSISENRKPVDSNRIIKETFPGKWNIFNTSIKLSGIVKQIKK